MTVLVLDEDEALGTDGTVGTDEEPEADPAVVDLVTVLVLDEDEALGTDEEPEADPAVVALVTVAGPLEAEPDVAPAVRGIAVALDITYIGSTAIW